MSRTIDYSDVLADLRSRKADLLLRQEQEREALDAMIASVEKWLPVADTAAVEATTVEELLSATPYAGRPLGQAAILCLRAHGKPMKTPEIAEALRAGGLETTSSDFRNTVYATLARKKDLFRVEGGVWSLREWEREEKDGTPE